MAEGDDTVMKESVSSLTPNNQNSNQDALSAEDVAWINSCFDSDILDDDWSSMRDALLDLQNDSSITTLTDLETLPSSSVITDTPQSLPISFNNMVSMGEEEMGNHDNDSNNTLEINENTSSENSLANAYLPGSSDGMLPGGGNNVSGPFTDFTLYDIEEVSAEDIFKVWDLNIPESCYELTTPSISDELKISKELEEVSLDDLIAGIEDLSLAKNSD